jgi:hypothetical protein
MAQHGPVIADHNGGRRPAEEGHNRYLLSCARCRIWCLISAIPYKIFGVVLREI